MEWTNPTNLSAHLQEEWSGSLVKAIYTQWEDDDLEADENLTEFEAIFVQVTMSPNSLQGVDGTFEFQSSNQEEILEILMDFPLDDEDVVAALEGDQLKIFGNESTLLLQRK